MEDERFDRAAAGVDKRILCLRQFPMKTRPLGQDTLWKHAQGRSENKSEAWCDWPQDIGAVDYHRANFSTDRRVSAEFLLFNPDGDTAVTVAFNRSALGPVRIWLSLNSAFVLCEKISGLMPIHVLFYMGSVGACVCLLCRRHL